MQDIDGVATSELTSGQRDARSERKALVHRAEALLTCLAELQQSKAPLDEAPVTELEQPPSAQEVRFDEDYEPNSQVKDLWQASARCICFVYYCCIHTSRFIASEGGTDVMRSVCSFGCCLFLLVQVAVLYLPFVLLLSTSPGLVPPRVGAKDAHASVWPLELGLRNPTLQLGPWG